LAARKDTFQLHLPGKKQDAPLAQLAEQVTLNQGCAQGILVELPNTLLNLPFVHLGQ
jgi:hypothetical protein